MTELEQAVKAEQKRLIEIVKANLIDGCDCAEPNDVGYWTDKYLHEYPCQIGNYGYQILVEMGADLSDKPVVK